MECHPFGMHCPGTGLFILLLGVCQFTANYQALFSNKVQYSSIIDILCFHCAIAQLIPLQVLIRIMVI